MSVPREAMTKARWVVLGAIALACGGGGTPAGGANEPPAGSAPCALGVVCDYEPPGNFVGQRPY